MGLIHDVLKRLPKPNIATDGYIKPRPAMIKFPEIPQPPEGKVNHVQVGRRLIIADGKGPLRYFDLDTNKVHVYSPPGEKIPVRILTEIKPDTIIENRGGKAYLVKII